MSGVSVGIKVDRATEERTRRIMEEVVRRNADLSKPYRKFGAYLHRVTVDTFKKGGRHGEWPPLAPLTLILRKSRGGRTNPRRMLQDRGILKGGIAWQVGKRDMKFGTSAPHAALHQFGGDSSLTLPATTITPKNAKALLFIGRQGLPVFAARAHLPKRTFKTRIPARQFITYEATDDKVLVGYVEDHLMEGAR